MESTEEQRRRARKLFAVARHYADALNEAERALCESLGFDRGDPDALAAIADHVFGDETATFDALLVALEVEGRRVDSCGVAIVEIEVGPGVDAAAVLLELKRKKGRRSPGRFGRG